MLFPTLDYLFFLPLVVGLYWAVPRKYRGMVIIIASLLFYGSWSLAYLPLLVGIAAMSWGLGCWIENQHQSGKPISNFVFLGAIVSLFIPLILFKYWDWLGWNINTLIGYTGSESQIPMLDWVLPVGISFFTFQAVAYVVDVKRKGKAERKFGRFFAFIAFFPQLVAGPIVRRHELLPQLKYPPYLSSGMISEGIYRIMKGMAKKLLIADVMRSAIVDPTFADPEMYLGIELWVALYAYTLQIYYDFSAYTDIAIGSALFFGIRLPENFNRPYKATSVAEFWRRWHITLSNWVRDYIYYPLGGARADKDWKVYRNILITMVVIGIWHGASWNFVIYGILHGSMVGINRLQRKIHGRRPGEPLPNWWAYAWRFALTINFVVLCRILFRAPDLESSWLIFTGLFDFYAVLPRYSPLAMTLLVLGYAIHFTPKSWEQDLFSDRFQFMWPVTQAVFAAIVAAICWKMGAGETLSFVYYKF